MDTLRKITKIAVLTGLTALAATVYMKQPDQLFSNEEQAAVKRIAKFRRCVRNKQLLPGMDVEARLARRLGERFDRAAAGGNDLDLRQMSAEVSAADYLQQVAEKSCDIEQETNATEIAAQRRVLDVKYGPEFMERQIRALDFQGIG